MTDIVFAAGLGSTGSSALVDLLREFDDFYSPNDEFRLFVDPDGIVNLKNAFVDNWSIFQTDMALRRFEKLVKQLNRKWIGNYFRLDHRKYFDQYMVERSNKLINDLTQVKYNGLWYAINNFYYAYLIRTNFIHDSISRSWFNSRPMRIGKKLTGFEFDALINEYINDLVSYCLDKNNKSKFCFNENFSAMFPNNINSMVKGSKIVLVVRDPRDVYADSLRVKWLGMPNKFEDYLEWQRSIYNGWMDIQTSKEINLNNLLVIKFEDLVGDYENTKIKVF
ncbi:hypothetical protein AB4450_13015, partial [Vibrio breoganii]